MDAIDTSHFIAQPVAGVDAATFDLLLGMVDDSEYDLRYDGADLLTGQQLQSAIIISVYTDAEVDGKKGWWGDSFNDQPVADCKLWTLMGASPTVENISLGNNHIKAATQWLVGDGHVDSIKVQTEHHNNHLDYLAFHILCIKSGRNVAEFNLPLGNLWQ